ncbi:MAG: outer membrane lipoprotein-sorting protein, partial [Deltaproteobacteria bacterium]|nr:outer membrane lipoprotein-sorting protein [Deltaproteobacteria bacterium]
GFLVRGRNNADDDRYIYVPAMGRVSRIVGSGRGGSFMSSDFSYEDIGSPDLEDWVWTLAGTAEVDGHACQLVEATPVDDSVRKDTGYTKVVYAIDQALKTSRATDFYDKQGAKFKHLQVSEIQDLNGVPFATDMIMTDLGNGHTSQMKMEDLAVDQGVDSLWFTNRALQKGF